MREVVHGRPVRNKEALANPEALELFRTGLPELKSVHLLQSMCRLRREFPPFTGIRGIVTSDSAGRNCVIDGMRAPLQARTVRRWSTSGRAHRSLPADGPALSRPIARATSTTRRSMRSSARSAAVARRCCSFDEAGVMQFVAWRGLSDGYRAAVDGHSPWKPDDRDPDPIFVSDIDETDEPDWLKDRIKGGGHPRSRIHSAGRARRADRQVHDLLRSAPRICRPRGRPRGNDRAPARVRASNGRERNRRERRRRRNCGSRRSASG